ncbi:MAG: hypothetical protein IT548_19250 [Alphaproteobacteria bacterium]|nr:hypothetical protein [Alphaproteobacteria bacterium]
MLSFARRKVELAVVPPVAEPEPDMVIDVARARLALARKGRAAGPAAPAIRAALGSIEDALIAIDAIRAALDEAAELVTEALGAKDEARRALYADRYDDLRHAITEASGATVKEADCLTAHARARLEVALDGNGRMRHIVRGCDLSSGNEGLDLPPPLEAFAGDAEIEAARDAIAAAFARLDRAAQVFLDDAGALTAAAQL